MLLVQLIGLWRNRLQSFLFEGFRASLGCFHLLRCCRSEVNIYNLVFVLIFLTGEELHEARVGVPGISWTEMQCPKTYNKELRKIAKVIPENLATKPENL